VLRASATFDLRAPSDDAFVVIATGTRPLSPVIPADARDVDAVRAVRPWAMTGAIWVDADGDGQALSRRAR
jgi:hypothetical protein